MSVQAAPSTTAQPQISHEDVKQVFDIVGYPVYALGEGVTVDLLRKKGHDIFFVLGIVNEKNEKNQQTSRNGLFKVIDDAFGFSVTEVSFSTFNWTGVVKESAQFKLPKIPWVIADKMDKFFRTVANAIDTESIVMLTYDKNFLDTPQPSEGWGFYVPNQKNSSVECDYERHEISSHLAANPGMILAGSAHSHPGMPAYFSGTDHKDQADWPGIHITYGWQGPHATAPTEYHVELILGGKSWNFNSIWDIIEKPPTPTFEHSLEADLAKVKKAPPASKYLGHNKGSYSFGTGSTFKAPSGGDKSPKTQGPRPKAPTINLPTNAPKADQNVIVISLLEDDTHCPACTVPITQKAFDHNRCYCCNSFLLSPNDTLDEAFNLRQARQLPDTELINTSSPVHPIWIWTRDIGSDNKVLHAFELIAGESDLKK